MFHLLPWIKAERFCISRSKRQPFRCFFAVYTPLYRLTSSQNSETGQAAKPKQHETSKPASGCWFRVSCRALRHQEGINFTCVFIVSLLLFRLPVDDLALAQLPLKPEIRKRCRAGHLADRRQLAKPMSIWQMYRRQHDGEIHGILMLLGASDHLCAVGNTMTSSQRIIGLLIFTIFMLIVQYRLYRPRALRTPAFHWGTRAVIILVVSLLWVVAFIDLALSRLPH